MVLVIASNNSPSYLRQKKHEYPFRLFLIEVIAVKEIA
jgi:hypothetical protein